MKGAKSLTMKGAKRLTSKPLFNPSTRGQGVGVETNEAYFGPGLFFLVLGRRVLVLVFCRGQSGFVFGCWNVVACEGEEKEIVMDAFLRGLGERTCQAGGDVRLDQG